MARTSLKTDPESLRDRSRPGRKPAFAGPSCNKRPFTLANVFLARHLQERFHFTLPRHESGEDLSSFSPDWSRA